MMPVKATADSAPGRERDLREVLSAYAEVKSRGAPWGVLWVRGPDGIGKSHLLGAACRVLAEGGAPVLQGRGGPEAWSLFAPLVKPLVSLAAEAGTSARDLSD